MFLGNKFFKNFAANKTVKELSLGLCHNNCSEYIISPLMIQLPCPHILSIYLPIYLPAAAAAKSLQSCPTLCDPIDSSPPGSPIPGILQARTLEWVAISFSNA